MNERNVSWRIPTVEFDRRGKVFGNGMEWIYLVRI